MQRRSLHFVPDSSNYQNFTYLRKSSITRFTRYNNWCKFLVTLGPAISVSKDILRSASFISIAFCRPTQVAWSPSGRAAIFADISSSYKVVSQLRGVWQVYSARRNVKRFVGRRTRGWNEVATRNGRQEEEKETSDGGPAWKCETRGRPSRNYREMILVESWSRSRAFCHRFAESLLIRNYCVVRESARKMPRNRVNDNVSLVSSAAFC